MDPIEKILNIRLEIEKVRFGLKKLEDDLIQKKPSQKEIPIRDQPDKFSGKQEERIDNFMNKLKTLINEEGFDSFLEKGDHDLAKIMIKSALKFSKK